MSKVFCMKSALDGSPIYRWSNKVWVERCGKKEILALIPGDLSKQFPYGIYKIKQNLED
jgi:hypothetical protein